VLFRSVAVLPRARLRERRAALPEVARRDPLRRPEARDGMTWFLRRAGLGDLADIMRIETATFANDAWSEKAMAAELESEHTYYLVAERNDTGEVQGYAGLLAPAGSRQG